MSGRDQVQSLDEGLELEEVKDEVLVEEARNQLVGNDKRQDLVKKGGLHVGIEGVTLESADLNENYLSGTIHSRGSLDAEESCVESFGEKNLGSRAYAILAEDANDFEDTRKTLKDTDAGGNVVDVGMAKDNRVDFVGVANSPDVNRITNELHSNQLLPDNEAKGSNNIQNEIYIADASGSPVDSEKLTSFSDDEKNGDGKEIMVNDDSLSSKSKSLRENGENSENQIKEDGGSTVRSEELRKTREKLEEEDSERTDRKEEFDSLLETIGSDFANGTVESTKLVDHKDGYDETSKRGKKKDFGEDDVFWKNTHSAKFQEDISCNENKEHATSTSLDKLPSCANEKVTEGSCDGGLGVVEGVQREVDDFKEDSDRGNQVNFPVNNSPNSNTSSNIENEVENVNSKIRDNFEEEESEYHSVASYKYSSFESLDEEETQRNNKEDWVLGSEIEKEAIARGMLGSETDRTDDDYVTCDEASSFANESIEGCDGDIGDYKGHEAQEYLTADEQSEFGGEPQGIGNMDEKECDAGDSAKENEDDRSTIAGSDDELGEESKENGLENDINHIGKPDDSGILNEIEEERTENEKNVEEKNHEYEKTDDEMHEKGNRIDAEEVTDNFGAASGEKKVVRRKKSFFSSMMAKKEAKITEKIVNYTQRYEVAMEGIAQANARLKQAKSDLPLMIVEKRIPKFEELQRKTDRLEQLKTRLNSYIEYNRSANAYIQNWRTKESHIQNKRAEFETFRNKTSERQKLLMACKKRQSFLHSELIRHDDLQLHKKRRIQQLTERLDMLRLRQTEQRNLVKIRIEGAKKYCEMSIREAAKVVVVGKKVNALKMKEKELEDKVFKIKKEMKKVKQMRKEKEFEVERAHIQKSVKAMKKERGW